MANRLRTTAKKDIQQCIALMQKKVVKILYTLCNKCFLMWQFQKEINAKEKVDPEYSRLQLDINLIFNDWSLLAVINSSSSDNVTLFFHLFVKNKRKL